MKKLTLFTLTVLLFSCGNTPETEATPTTESLAQGQQAPRNISVEEFNALLKEKPQAQILDVRSDEEFQSGYIAGAKNIDVMEDGFEAALSQLDKTKPVFVYCAAGGRSSKAVSILYKNGFTELYNLNGGMGAWNAAGLPVKK